MWAAVPFITIVDDIIGGTWVLVHHTKRELKYVRYYSVCVNAIFCLIRLHPFSNRPTWSVFIFQPIAEIVLVEFVDRCDFSPFGRGGALKSPVNLEAYRCMKVCFVFV